MYIGQGFRVMDLSERGGDGNEKGGSSPKKSTESDDVGPVVTGGEVGGERVASGLDNGSVECERAQSGRVSVQGCSDLLVHSRQQGLVGTLHYSGEVDQD